LIRLIFTSITSVQCSSRFFENASRRAANLAWRGFESSTYRMIRSIVRLQGLMIKYQQENEKCRPDAPHLSCGTSWSSHFTTAANACKLASTKIGFFSSAIAFTSSPTCGLYKAGQCLDVYVNIVCAWCADDCPRLFLPPSLLCTCFTSVGIDD